MSSNESSSSSPADAKALTEQLVFHPGDTFQIKQTFFGLGGLPSALWRAQEGERQVTVDAYTPGQKASLSWRAETEQETQTSVQARVDYEKRIATRKPGDAYPPPPAVDLETVTAQGSVEFIDLQRSHTLSLPAYWLPGPTSLLDQRSAIWLSEDAYRELERTRATDLYFDVTSQAASELLNSSKEWVDAVRRLRDQEVTTAKKTEPARLHVDGEAFDWPLMINGQQKMVKVLKAKNDFGEILVLANQNNPFIVKVTVNPLFPGMRSAALGKTDWNTLFGYEIRALQLPSLTSSAR